MSVDAWIVGCCLFSWVMLLTTWIGCNFLIKNSKMLAEMTLDLCRECERNCVKCTMACLDAEHQATSCDDCPHCSDTDIIEEPSCPGAADNTPAEQGA